MRIKASVGHAPVTASLDNTVYSMTLTAQSPGEKQWLAELFKAVRSVSEQGTRLRESHPGLRIVEKKKGTQL